MSPVCYDQLTLRYYSQNAAQFSATPVQDRCKRYLRSFADKLPPGANVLDLGCGGGWASQVLSRNGFDVFPLDAVPELAAIASAKVGGYAQALRFDQIEVSETYDGIFACDALHYVPRQALPSILGLLSRALRPGGILFASFKQGNGEYRDGAGRYYACYAVDELRTLSDGHAGFSFMSLKTDSSPDLSGENKIFLGLCCRRPVQVWR